MVLYVALGLIITGGLSGARHSGDIGQGPCAIDRPRLLQIATGPFQISRAKGLR